jgi:hypothetical protein
VGSFVHFHRFTHMQMRGHVHVGSTPMAFDPTYVSHAQRLA